MASTWANAAEVNPAMFVAERNLAPTGSAVVHFPQGADRVSAFNGALSYDLPIGPTFPVGGHLSYQLRLHYSSVLWEFPFADRTLVSPTAIQRPTNAGFGWDLGFGELLAPASLRNPSNSWVYRSAAGRWTRFYTNLNDGEASEPGVFYSRDGTYLRLRIIGALAKVEHPGGTVTEFAANGVDWRFTARRDVFGNFVRLAYTSATLWTLSDTHGRTHQIHLVSGQQGPIVDRIELAAFGGTKASYDLTYSTANVSSPSPGTVLQVPVLRRVDLPDGSAYQMDYIWNSVRYDSGRMKSLVLPTGGYLYWNYATLAFPMVTGAEHAAAVVGVSMRRAYERRGGPELGRWTLSRQFDRAVDPRDLKVTEARPDGTKIDRYFSVYVTGSAANDTGTANFDVRHYGLPFTLNQGESDYPLSRMMRGSDGQPVQSHRLRYALSSCGGCFDSQPRVDLRQTIDHLSVGESIASTIRYGDWNGLGRFRTTDVLNLFGSPFQSTTIDYSSTPPGPSAPWVLGTPSQTTTTQGTVSKTRESCYDPATGVLLRERVRAGTQQGSTDLVHSYHYHPSGDLHVKRYYGGDLQAIAAGNLCTLGLPASEQYASFVAYQYGSPRRKGWLNANGSVFLETYSATIDRNTGLVKSSHVGDEFLRTYAYDAQGRLTDAAPPPGHGGRIQKTYGVSDSTNPASRSSVKLEANGLVLSESRLALDPFGVTFQSGTRTSAGWSTTTGTRDALGRVTSVTDADGSVTQYLDYDALGRAGRIVRPDGEETVLTYLGSHETSRAVSIGKLDLSGDLQTAVRTTTAWTDLLGRVYRERTEDSDGQWRTETYVRNIDGEVTRVTLTDGTNTVTRDQTDATDGRGFVVRDEDGAAIDARYDALGNRTRHDFGHGALTYTFDRAGRLRDRKRASDGQLWSRETYGTSSSNGNYAKGKLVGRLRINRNIRHLPNEYVQVREAYTYTGDRGSLSEVATRVIAGWGNSMPLFEFTTAAEQDGAGRLRSSVYPDCVPDSDPNDADDCHPLPLRTLDYHYDFGQLTAVTAEVGGTPESWISSISYDPSGFMSQRTFGNGVVEQRTPDEGGGNRVGRLTLQHAGSGSFYDSGEAVYDGLGRLLQLGLERVLSPHAYDLSVPEPPADAEPPVALPPDTGPRDIFGNLLRRQYTVPSRFLGGDTDDVTEIYVYGPGERLLWRRMFDEYDAYAAGASADRWYLADASGRSLRVRAGTSHYQGLFQTIHTAELQNVSIWARLEDNLDRVYLGGQLLGTSDGRLAVPLQSFYHRDFRGTQFATSDGDGQIEPIEVPLP